LLERIFKIKVNIHAKINQQKLSQTYYFLPIRPIKNKNNMKRLLFFFILIPMLSISQVSDHFTDGNFTQNPSWIGDSNHFEINSIHQLHLNSSGADTSTLSTISEWITETEWSFWTKISFNTSTNNYIRIYLTADSARLDNQIKGYYIQLGGADDSIVIFRQNGKECKRIQSFQNYLTNKSTNVLRIKITRDNNGNWETYLDTIGETNYIRDRSFIDTTFHTSNFFGVFCRYTSSNSTKIYFDDFYVGHIQKDSIPPSLASCNFEDSTHIQVVFSENLKRPECEDPQHYFLLHQGIKPEKVNIDLLQPPKVRLQFSSPFEVGMCDTLKITGIPDLSGNLIKESLAPICFYHPRTYDILINEIMYDPEPQVALPAQEYIELFNRTSFPIDLHDWIFYFGSQQKKIPNVIIKPQGYLLLVKDTNLYYFHGETVQLFTSGSSLSNEGATLTLKDKEQKVIHSVSYSPDWFHSYFKEEGGWSLEMVDPMNPCGCEENWRASVDAAGGTPGKENSVSGKYTDEVAPKAERAFIEDSTTLYLCFSEPMDSISMKITGFHERFPDDIIHKDILLIAPSYKSAKLKYDVPFLRGITYTVSFTNTLTDCAGNKIDTSLFVRAAIPDTIRQSDIVINEILFNPQSGGSRFIELFNRSLKNFDLSTLLLSNQDFFPGETDPGKPISAERFLLFPEDYVVISPDPEDVCSRYHCWNKENFIIMKDFPGLNDDSGTVVLTTKDNGLVIDKMHYDREMQYPLLVSEEGVSLERLSPERSSEYRENWHSASETEGFATPGRQNSQQSYDINTDSPIVLFPEIFSPDNDGRNDVLNIELKTEEPGYQATVIIFDAKGKPIRHLINNVLISNSEIFSWDGIDDNRTKATIGFYIVYIEIFKPDGTVKSFKKCTILGAQF